MTSQYHWYSKDLYEVIALCAVCLTPSQRNAAVNNHEPIVRLLPRQQTFCQICIWTFRMKYKVLIKRKKFLCLIYFKTVNFS